MGLDRQNFSSHSHPNDFPRSEGSFHGIHYYRRRDKPPGSPQLAAMRVVGPFQVDHGRVISDGFLGWTIIDSGKVDPARPIAAEELRRRYERIVSHGNLPDGWAQLGKRPWEL
jgi:hypothetical protein